MRKIRKARSTVARRALIGTAVAAGLVAAGVVLKPVVRVNATPSMPVGLYTVHRASADLKPGDIVVMCLPSDAGYTAFQRGYIGHGECPGDFESVLKPVAAVAGDTVILEPGGAWVDGVPMAGTAAMPNDSAGRPIEHYPFGTYQVAPGTFWVFSTHDSRSLDSRYFGPVPVANVISRASPLFTSK